MKRILASRKLRLIAFALASFFAIWYGNRHLSVLEMASSSMEPTISGQGNPPGRHGDLLVISSNVHHPPKVGDLVLVTLSTEQPVDSVRRVAGVPGDAIDTPKKLRIETGHYYLLGDSTNSIDSRQLGPVAFGSVKGKVVWVAH